MEFSVPVELCLRMVYVNPPSRTGWDRDCRPSYGPTKTEGGRLIETQPPSDGLLDRRFSPFPRSPSRGCRRCFSAKAEASGSVSSPTSRSLGRLWRHSRYCSYRRRGRVALLPVISCAAGADGEPSGPVAKVVAPPSGYGESSASRVELIWGLPRPLVVLQIVSRSGTSHELAEAEGNQAGRTTTSQLPTNRSARAKRSPSAWRTASEVRRIARRAPARHRARRSSPRFSCSSNNRRRHCAPPE